MIPGGDGAPPQRTASALWAAARRHAGGATPNPATTAPAMAPEVAACEYMRFVTVRAGRVAMRRPEHTQRRRNPTKSCYNIATPCPLLALTGRIRCQIPPPHTHT